MSDATIAYNPFDPSQVDHHDGVLAQLREAGPVHELLPGFFYVTRAHEIVEICRKPNIFQQGRFIPLEEDTRPADELNLGETNPPQHTRVRKVLAGVLSPPKVRAMEPLVRDVCAGLVDAFADRGHADMIADLGVPLPGAVIGPITGLPPESHSQFRAYSDAYMLRADPDDRPSTRELLQLPMVRKHMAVLLGVTLTPGTGEVGHGCAVGSYSHTRYRGVAVKGLGYGCGGIKRVHRLWAVESGSP